MPDITKCRGNFCPLRESCYRYTSKASMYQSYFSKTPYSVDSENQCDYYWKVASEETPPKS